MRREEKKKLRCIHCAISYKSNFCLKLHSYIHQQYQLRSYEYSCDVCSKKFFKVSAFENHKILHKSQSASNNNAGELINKYSSHIFVVIIKFCVSFDSKRDTDKERTKAKVQVEAMLKSLKSYKGLHKIPS